MPGIKPKFPGCPPHNLVAILSCPETTDSCNIVHYLTFVISAYHTIKMEALKEMSFHSSLHLQESDVYSNVVVVQHDDELIMPGDAAFTLECDFSRPTNVTVSADLANR
jgi:hypothetical protein